jgi:hypothetical protein
MKLLSLVSIVAGSAVLAACAPLGPTYSYNTVPASYAYSSRALGPTYTTTTRTYTTVLGAGPVVNGTLCRDGTVLPLNSRCGLHGGIAY